VILNGERSISRASGGALESGLVACFARVYSPGVCIVAFLVWRGIGLMASWIAERRGRRPPPDTQDDELVLAA
jgi:hypothetical protein